MFYFCDESKSSKIKTCKNVFSLWTPSGQKLHWVRFTLVCVAQHRHLHLVCSQLLFFLHLLERSYSFARSAEKDLLYGLSGKTACMLGLGVRFFVLIFYETTQWVKTSTLLKLSCWKLHVVSKRGSSLCCLISVAAVLWAGTRVNPDLGSGLGRFGVGLFLDSYKFFLAFLVPVFSRWGAGLPWKWNCSV